MSEHKDQTVFDEAIRLGSGYFLHVTITIIDVLAREGVHRA
jgi:hypothetical protein